MIPQCCRLTPCNKNQFWKPLFSARRGLEEKSAFVSKYDILCHTRLFKNQIFSDYQENNKYLTNSAAMLHFLVETPDLKCMVDMFGTGSYNNSLCNHKRHLLMTACSWPPYLKVLFPVFVFRNNLLWHHFIFLYESSINIWRHNTQLNNVVTYEEQDIKFLPVSAIYIGPTLLQLAKTKYEPLYQKICKYWLPKYTLTLLVTTLNFQLYFRMFILSHTNCYRNYSEWNSTLSDCNLFLSFYRQKLKIWTSKIYLILQT
jgi:hypothetical protein